MKKILFYTNQFFGPGRAYNMSPAGYGVCRASAL